MAWRSPAVQSAIYYLVQQCHGITLPVLRSPLLELLANPAPTFFSRYPTADSRSAILEHLQTEGFIEQTVTEGRFFPPCHNPLFSPQPFWSAPGSDYDRHHSHPGGLALHTALNLKLSLAAADAYQQTYGHKLDYDLLVSAQILHDCMKPWVLQWQADGSILPQLRTEGSGSHHIFGLAESIYRGLPPMAIIAQCCTRSAPGDASGETEVVRWLQAGALLAGRDAVEYGLIGLDGRLPRPHRQEWYLSHLSDHDCILSIPGASLMIRELQELACSYYSFTPTELTGPRFHAFRNWVFSQCTISHLHQIYIDRGQTGLLAKISDYIEPD
jgi:hypothetical protein